MQLTILGIANKGKIEDVNGGEPTEFTKKVNVKDYEDTIKNNYTKPNINADDIIREALSYSRITYNAGSKRYGDAATDINVKPAYKKTSDESFAGYTGGSSDCAGLVYATLRHLGVRLINFSDIIGGENKRQNWSNSNKYMVMDI